MSNINQPSGWRKATAGLAISEQLAQAGEQVAFPKARAFVAVKRVGAHIGLKAGDMMLLDTLGAFTQAQDWEEGRRPIVWASNAYLMEQTGFSLSALKRHARRLAEIGVISFKDSPNGKRWGRRDVDGVIIEAYGFDLSPLSARVEEFEQLRAELQAERELCQRLKRQITVARRMIRARIEAGLSGALSGPWTQLAGLFEDLLARLPRRNEASERLVRLLAWFKELQGRVEAAYLNATQADEAVENTAENIEQGTKKTQELNPREVISEPHILITTQLHPVTCNRSETEQAAGVVPNASPEEQVDRELEDWVAETRKKRGAALDLPTIMQACPEFASWARSMGGYLKDWSDLHRVAGQLRPMIGVSEHAWNLAQDRLGPQIATAALVLTFDKHCAGEVASPGGYLRGMVEKAGAGELHLERSFYGRLSGQAA
ncbi:plasmid replication protein RepC [Aliiroseovarius subalbicans]|uniref:plasmid replication protein RepC n=1 Tax=Aliiroseovarius subalbicans TaxID=2925840 RepID=UPI001F577FE0|nr:plasmid replication protein RepC [Aliiroseovarius subalbicans]MCI2400982.1 replication initiation protein RepC [Aliiroseovarius subalbicans]